MPEHYKIFDALAIKQNSLKTNAKKNKNKQIRDLLK